MAVGDPIGDDLCVGTTAGNTLPEWGDTPSWEEREITLGAGVELISGEKYTIVARAVIDGDAEIFWSTRIDDPTADGNLYKSSNSGDTWISYPTQDSWFKTKANGVEKDTGIFDPDGFNRATQFYGAEWKAQTFTAGSTYTISSVILKLAKYTTWGGTPGIITVSIRATAGTPAAPTNPSPGHEDTDVEFPTTPLSYDASDDPPADTYDIYFRIQGEIFTKIAETEDVTSWRMPYNILNIKDYNPATGSGYRSPIAGDVLTHGDDSYTITYVTVGDLINVQYQAKLYAFRTTGSGGKNPGDVLTNGVAPDVENPQAVRVTLNDQWHFYGVVEEIFLPPGTTFEWRVDATNEVGTTEGNVWEFTTQALKIPKVSYILITGGSGAGPYDYPPGEEGTDWNWTGENNMVSIRRLVAAANGKIWIEDI